MKLLSLILVLVTSSVSWAGRETGGMRVDENVNPILNRIKTELAQQVRVMPSKALANRKVPAKWTADRIANVIDDLRVDASPESLSKRDGAHLKILDFDRKEETITVLAGFFLAYKRDLERPQNLQHTFDDIKTALLYEVSHLWNLGEDTNAKAKEFSQDFIKVLAHDTLTCNFKYILDDGSILREHAVFELGTNHYSFRTGYKDFDKKIPFPKVYVRALENPAPRNVVSTGGFEWRIDGNQVVFKDSGWRGNVFRVNREVDDNNEAKGTFYQGMFDQSTNPKKYPEQPVNCEFGVPR